MENTPPEKVEADLSKKAKTSLILGIIGMIAWVLPIAGFPIQITGLVFGIKGKDSAKRGSAIAGITLCIIGLVFTTLNSIWGAYLGATGQFGL